MHALFLKSEKEQGTITLSRITVFSPMCQPGLAGKLGWAWGEASKSAPSAAGDLATVTVSEWAPGVIIDGTVATGQRE